MARRRALTSTRMRTTPHPELVEAELGVKEYWFENHRRAIVATASPNCIFISIDLYSEKEPEKCSTTGETRPITTPTSLLAANTSIEYIPYDNPRELELNNTAPHRAWLVYLRTPISCEIIGLQAIYCGIEKSIPKRSLWELYRRIVLRIEGRDPAEKPLRPLPVGGKYVLERIGLGHLAETSDNG